jgi:precorrin-2 dehydrogenase/sirohydrochlorin ferrochelatase
MCENYQEDFSGGSVVFMPLSLIAGKIRVLIVGGGKAGYMKARSFLSRGCHVTVAAMDFKEGLEELRCPDLCLIKAPYNREFIKNVHLVVIAVSQEAVAERIQEDCQAEYKLYLYSGEATRGLFVIPAAEETREGVFTFHTKKGSPATTKFIRTKIKEQLSEYDSFIEFACSLRDSLKGDKNRSKIMDFVNTEDFYSFYQKQKHVLVLKLFYGGMKFEASYCIAQKCLGTSSNR